MDTSSRVDTTGERDELRAVVRRVLEKESPPARVRAAVEEPEGHDASLWQRMAELGWTGLEIPEAYGGAGYGFEELAVVLEELGRHVTPGPFFSTVVLGAGAVLAAGDDRRKSELLPAIAAGTCKVALVAGHVSGSGGDGPVVHDGVLHGTASFVLDAHQADVLIVAARHDDSADTTSTSLFVVRSSTPGVGVRVRPSIDTTRKLCDVTFDGVAADTDAVLGSPRGGAQVVRWLVDRAASALALDCVGGAQRILEMSVDYAKVRVQFGRPIGTFQAIKHKCADMLLLVEASRVAAEDAAARATFDVGEPNIAAAIAKSYAGDAYAKVTGDALQLHGGIGFTWDHDLHLYFKRSKLNQVLYGDAMWHRAQLADVLLPRP